MGFPSPAADYAEGRISLDETLIGHPAATYFMRASGSYLREGIMKGALLVVDSSLSPYDGALLICTTDDELRIKRYRAYPQPHLINLENRQRERLPEEDVVAVSQPIFGVITYIINAAGAETADDRPVA